MVTSGGLVLLAVWIAGAMVIVFRPEWLVPPYDDKWSFPWGEYDLFRRCLYNEDGKMRRFVPAALLIWLTFWTLFVAILTQVFL